MFSSFKAVAFFTLFVAQVNVNNITLDINIFGRNNLVYKLNFLYNIPGNSAVELVRVSGMLC